MKPLQSDVHKFRTIRFLPGLFSGGSGGWRSVGQDLCFSAPRSLSAPVLCALCCDARWPCTQRDAAMPGRTPEGARRSHFMYVACAKGIGGWGATTSRTFPRGLSAPPKEKRGCRSSRHVLQFMRAQCHFMGVHMLEGWHTYLEFQTPAHVGAAQTRPGEAHRGHREGANQRWETFVQHVATTRFGEAYS